MNLTNRIQAQEHLNKQLNERLTQQDQTTVNVQSQTVSPNEQENITLVGILQVLLHFFEYVIYLAIERIIRRK
jgi:preprotein translocase subunit SecF